MRPNGRRPMGPVPGRVREWNEFIRANGNAAILRRVQGEVRAGALHMGPRGPFDHPKAQKGMGVGIRRQAEDRIRRWEAPQRRDVHLQGQPSGSDRGADRSGEPTGSEARNRTVDGKSEAILEEGKTLKAPTRPLARRPCGV